MYKYFKEDILDGDDDPDNVDLSTFDKLELRMVAVTTDGGVKKEVLRPGSGDIVYPGACVTSQSSLCCYLSLQFVMKQSVACFDHPSSASSRAVSILDGRSNRV